MSADSCSRLLKLFLQREDIESVKIMYEDQKLKQQFGKGIYLSYFIEELSEEGSKPKSRFGNQFTGSYLKP